ncbi:MAG: MATE family efflux transporter [bacterium]|nr:MATE family efflux transporter [bacterium]
MPDALMQNLTPKYREVVVLAYPVVLSMLSHTLMTAVDIALLGHFGTIEQGAVGLANAFLWLFIATCNCSGAGVNIFVAQYLGAQRYQACGSITWQGLYMSLVAWLPMLLGAAYADALVRLNAPSPELVSPAALYMRIRLLGGLPILLNFVLLSFFRGIGDTRTPLLVAFAAQCLNGLLDVLLIFGLAGFPRLGIAGSAIATVSATGASTLLYLGLFWRRAQRQGLLSKRWLACDLKACRRLFNVSWPVGLQGAVELGAWALFTTLVARLGSTEMAAHAIATQIMALSYMSGYGISIAAATLVGQYIGAQQIAQARQSMNASLVIIVLYMGALGLVFYLGRYPLGAFFTQAPEVVRLTAHLLVYVALFQVFDGISLVSTGVLRGAGDTRWPLYAGLLLNWALFVPLASVVMFALQGGVEGGWAVALCYVIVLSLVMLARVLAGQWQKLQLI